VPNTIQTNKVTHIKTCTQKGANNRVDGQMEVQLGEAINPPGRLHFNGEDSSQAQDAQASLLLAGDGTRVAKIQTWYQQHFIGTG
jgi:hypothetical protein